MPRYAIIHLSDLQFGDKFRFAKDGREFAKKIVNDLRECVDQFKIYPVYLLISGDLAETSHALEYEWAADEIMYIIDELCISKDHVIMVPGNHDVNWSLSEISETVGDPTLKFNNYNKFAERFNSHSKVKVGASTILTDNRLGVEYILLNSAEKESHNIHCGYINCIGLSDELMKNRGVQLFRIAVAHHRLDNGEIENHAEIEPILSGHNVKVFLSGHHHEIVAKNYGDIGKPLFCVGCGSTGVNKSEREDGVPNQYCIHVIDQEEKNIQTYWRKFNPRKKTKNGLGGWGPDDTMPENPTIVPAAMANNWNSVKQRMTLDEHLYHKLGILCNPFTHMNAEKFSEDQIVEFFVECEERHRGATRLEGDAIIRGKKGAGKTMLLRYLHAFGIMDLRNAIKTNRVAPVFPVYVNFSASHRSNFSGTVDEIMTSASAIISQKVIESIEYFTLSTTNKEMGRALVQLRERMAVLRGRGNSELQNLGQSVIELFRPYFSKVLLLIDEVAPVFPRHFFQNNEVLGGNGFFRWMNSIRSSGPYFTRIAVYPNDVSDQLNEERFGGIVNLEYDIKNDLEIKFFRKYAFNLINTYLEKASPSREQAVRIDDVIDATDRECGDSLEQILYASDGSTRRLTRIMDKCIEVLTTRDDIKQITKDECLKIIREIASTLFISYRFSDQELANKAAVCCKRQGTFRFKSPGNKSLLYALHASREEINVLKLTESGSGRRGVYYEFTFPFCVFLEIPTHIIKDRDGKRIDHNRAANTGRWINVVTNVRADDLKFDGGTRIHGEIHDIDDGVATIEDAKGMTYITEDYPDSATVGARVSFLSKDEIAFDVVLE